MEENNTLENMKFKPGDTVYHKDQIGLFAKGRPGIKREVEFSGIGADGEESVKVMDYAGIRLAPDFVHADEMRSKVMDYQLELIKKMSDYKY